MIKSLLGSPRIIILGTSAAGKSTFAARLAEMLAIPHIELDSLFWGSDWTPKPAAEFFALADAATVGKAWIVDGNYGSARSVIWPRANVVIWLNYSLATVLWRGLKRTFRRSMTREILWHGNRESVQRAFFSRESLLLWIANTHRQRTAQFNALRDSNDFPNLLWIEFTTPLQASKWLTEVAHTSY
jgi:adenylate kinase family enzyme